MVDGGFRHDWRQHLGRLFYLRARLGGFDRYDLFADVRRIFFRLSRCGFCAFAPLLSSASDQHLRLAWHTFWPAYATHRCLVFYSQQARRCGCSSVFGLSHHLALHFARHCGRLYGRDVGLYPAVGHCDGPHLALHAPQRHQGHCAHRRLADTLPALSPRCDDGDGSSAVGT